MLHFEGERDFSQSPSNLWEKLSDARFLVDCVPGKEAASDVGPDRAACVLRPGFSFVRGTLNLTLRVADRVPDNAVRVQLHSKGIGSSSTVEVNVAVKPRDNGSRAHWTADVTELGGLLKAVPQGLIQASAQKVIADAWAAIEANLAAGR